MKIFLTDDMEGISKHDTGKWWAENNRFCMQFSEFSNGERKCPIIVSQGRELYATRGNGELINNWTLSRP